MKIQNGHLAAILGFLSTQIQLGPTMHQGGPMCEVSEL